MERANAIETICSIEITKLTNEERENLLLSWWCIDEEDIEFSRLSSDLQVEVLKHDEFPKDYMNTKYDLLLMETLKYNYKGVKNEYIEKQILTLTGTTVTVVGEPQLLWTCQCCRYRTLSERREYSVCPVCLWEDDGNDDNSLQKFSVPNNMTLFEARIAFAKRENTDLKIIDLCERYYRDDKSD